MAGVPINFAVPGEGSIASYNYTDIAEGTGIVNFYGACASTASATYDYFLTSNTNTISAQEGNAALATGDNSFTFDVVFNLPKNMQGTAYTSVPFYLATGGAANSVYVKTQLFHVDLAAAETAITSQITSETKTNADASGTIHYYNCVNKLAITAKHFKQGEKLRLKVIATFVGAGSFGGIAFSPSNQVTGWTNSRLLAAVPFKIDL